MVKKNLLLSTVALLVILAVAGATSVQAQDRVYYFNHEYAKLWINPDRTVDLFYDRSLTLESGNQIHWIEIGQPTGDFTIGDATDQYGNALSTMDTSSGSDYKVRVTLNQPLQAGQTINFSLTTNVAGMLHDDTTNPGNVGLQFAPAWDTQTTIHDIRIMIVLPPNVTQDQVKTTQVLGSFQNDTETGNVAVYWETQDLAPNQQYIVGVSFPSTAVQPAPSTTAQPTGTGGPYPSIYPSPQQNEIDPAVLAGIVIAAIFFAFVAIALVMNYVKKQPYTKPKISMETLGIRRGLTAVEASYLLGLKPTQIVTEILYSLLQKRAVWVESSKPTLKLKVMPEYENKTGTDQNPLRYYEIDFLHALKPDGTLSEEKLAKTVMTLRDTLEEKLRGYSRKDTVDYYRKIVDKAWTQVDQAGTAQLASSAYDEQLLWLLLDPNYQKRTETSFQTRAFQPSPIWFWYWYGYTQYHPHPTYRPDFKAAKSIAAQAAKPAAATISTAPQPTAIPTQASPTPPSLPGADFANNIATSVEQTSNNIVASLEKFANAIVPPPPPPAKASHEPAHHGAHCVCACHACACACACVSCACACAGGGVG